MGLPNIGPLELIIILAIALLIVGPGRLPEMGNAIGRTIREFRNASSDITDATKVEPEQKAAAHPTPAPAPPAPASVEAPAAAEPAPPQPNTLSGEATPNTTAAPPASSADAAPSSRTDGDDGA